MIGTTAASDAVTRASTTPSASTASPSTATSAGSQRPRCAVSQVIAAASQPGRVAGRAAASVAALTWSIEVMWPGGGAGGTTRTSPELTRPSSGILAAGGPVSPESVAARRPTGPSGRVTWRYAAETMRCGTRLSVIVA